MNKIILILVYLFHLTVHFFLYVEHFKDTFSNHAVGLVSADLGSVQCSILSGKIFNSILVETNPNIYIKKKRQNPTTTKQNSPTNLKYPVHLNPLAEIGEVSGTDFSEYVQLCSNNHTSFLSLITLTSPPVFNFIMAQGKAEDKPDLAALL